MKRRFHINVNIAKTRGFPGTDNKNDHDLVMMSLRLRFRILDKDGSTRIKFNPDKLKDADI